MCEDSTELQRRTLLQTAAGLALAQVTPETAAARPPPGKPGEFDFLAGEWKISHRRLKTEGGNDWEEFTGEATCWTILGGVGSVEELRVPSRDFIGMGLRLLDMKQRVWSDFWVNGKSGVLGPAGLTGGFDQGVGTFSAEEKEGGEDGKPLLVRGVWDRITPRSCRWHQASSRDGGRSWQGSWYMDWVRA